MHKYLGTTYLYACIPLVEDLIIEISNFSWCWNKLVPLRNWLYPTTRKPIQFIPIQ